MATPPADQAVGAQSEPANGNRSSQKCWWKLHTIISPADGFDTARSSCAGGTTKIRAGAQWIRWSVAKARRSRSCDTFTILARAKTLALLAQRNADQVALMLCPYR